MTDQFLEAFEARRQAREQADRSFPLAGETLRYRSSVAPEVGMRLEAMRQQVYTQTERIKTASAAVDKTGGNGKGEAAIEELVNVLETLEVTDEAMIQIGDETVLACLDPSCHNVWAKLRGKDALQPLTFEEIFELADYLLGRVAGIPTSAPADSSAGRTPTASASKGKSSSRAKTPAGSGSLTT